MIRVCFDLSTAHLQRRTMRLLTELTADQRMGDGWPAMTVAPYLHGVFVTVPDKDQDLDNMPDDLAYVLGHARNYGATLIHFHSDGFEVPDLDVYTW